MERTTQVRIGKGDRQFAAERLDLPVVTQAPTLDELVIDIREAIGLHLIAILHWLDEHPVSA
jgi:predicted RNase H-like HicB family nuclease